MELAALPGVDYGNFKKSDPTGANGLTPYEPAYIPEEEVSTRSSMFPMKPIQIRVTII